MFILTRYVTATSSLVIVLIDMIPLVIILPSPHYISYYHVHFHIIYCHFLSYFSLFSSLFSLIIISFPSFNPITNHFINMIVPEVITWLSFDSIISYFSSLLLLWPGGTITSFFETSTLYHHMLTFLYPDSLSYYTTLAHFVTTFTIFVNYFFLRSFINNNTF